MGLVRDMVLARFFGSGVSADAFFVAFRIPNLLRRLFAEGSLTIAFIPVFTEYLTQKGRKEAFDVARTILTLLALVLSVSALLGVLLSPWIVRIQAFGFGGSGDRYELTVLLTRITFPYIFFISLVAFFMGVLNSLRHFGAPAAAPIFLNVGIIGAAYLISPHCPQPIVGIALGVLIGGILQVGLQIPWVLKEGLKIFPLWQPDHPAVRRIGLLMLPAIVGSAVYQFNQFMGTLLASFLPQGSVSWLYYADRLVQFPLGIFAIAISTAALPSLSAQAAMQDLDEFQDTLSYSLRLVFFVTLPCVIGLIVLGKPIIRIFFERGAFDSQSTIMTNKALFFYSVGLWAFSGIRVMVSAFYALQDTKTPVKVAIVAAVANLVFSLAFMGPLKHGGLALALSLASSLQFCLLVFFFKRKVPIGKLRAVLVSVSKSILAAASMGVGIYCLYSTWLSTHSSDGFWAVTIKLGALLLAGIAMYFLVARVIGCRELGSLLDMLRPAVRARGRSNRRAEPA
jgi:putative peptidoglycan lipid II flippase